jgi:hypothetical protein
MDQENNPGGAAQPSVDPAAPDTMNQIAQAMATLVTVLTMQLANNLSKEKAVQKPSLFKGEQGSNTRQFLAAFTMWVMVQGTAFNVINQQGNPVNYKEMEWICAALSYLQDNMAIWAALAYGGVCK